MDTTLTTLFVLIVVAAAALLLGHQVAPFKRSYYTGVSIWSRWLPVLATGVYLAVLIVNLASGGSVSGSSLSLEGFFSVPEILVLFLVGPLMLTRIGSMSATASVVYCLERLLLAQHPGTTAALYLVTGCVTIVAVLGDKMPWLAAEGPSLYAMKLREVLMIATTIGALSTLFAGLIKVHGFSIWIHQIFGLALPSTVAMLLLISLFIGWLSVALGFTRHFTIPLLALPTLLVAAYVTGWPSHLLVVPFALCFALALATAERRLQGARRGLGATIVLTR